MRKIKQTDALFEAELRCGVWFLSARARFANTVEPLNILCVLQNPPLWVLAAALAGGILTGLALHANTQPPSKPAKAA